VKPVTIHAAAEAEVETAVANYEAQREGLGREFRHGLESTIERIQNLPQAIAPVDDRGTRKRRLKRFPYTIYYVELDDTIWIVAVAHQRRRPGYWSGRER
jgi:toxin ParE1/3/4